MMPQKYVFYAFAVQSRHELAIARFLRARGLHAIVPLQAKAKRMGKGGRSGGREVQRSPAIYGYVFVARSAVKPDFDQVLRFQAIRSVVGFAGEPAPISDAVMQAWCKRLGEKPKPVPRDAFKRGQSVVVKEGPLANLAAVVEEVHGERAKVLVSLFGTQTQAVLPVANLREPSSEKTLAARNIRLKNQRESVNESLTRRARVPVSVGRKREYRAASGT